MKPQINPLLFVAGIGVGIFAYAMFAPQAEMSEAPPALADVLETNDVETLKRRLADSQRRVNRLENLLSTASIADRRLQEMTNPDGSSNEVTNFANLIDRSKPILRELILPELRKEVGNGGFYGDLQFNFWANSLEIDSDTRTQIDRELDALSEQRMERFIDQLEDNETSMFSIFQEMNDLQNVRDPEMEAIYRRHLSDEQTAAFDEKLFERQADRVDSDAANRLNLINTHIHDLSETQQDEIYVVLARSSPAYSPDMQIESGDAQAVDSSPLDAEGRAAAIESILEPHQISDWSTFRRRQEILSGIMP